MRQRSKHPFGYYLVPYTGTIKKDTQMKIILEISSRGTHGKSIRKRNTRIEGMSVRNISTADLKRFWEAEKTINELTNMELRINVEE